MTITVSGAALDQLEQVLASGCITLDRVRVVYDSLPGRAICSATIVDGLLWLVVDLDKPSANRHALAMVRETQRACEDYADALEQLTGRSHLALVG